MWVEGFTSTDGRTEIYHLDGIAWYKAPRPRKWHRCRAQTRGWINYFTYAERCACGAVGDGRSWIERNSRHNPDFVEATF